MAKTAVLILISLLPAICGNAGCGSPPLNGTASPATIETVPGSRVPVSVALPPGSRAHSLSWEVRPPDLGAIWYVATSPQDRKYRPELPADSNCGPDSGKVCGRIAVFVPVRDGTGEIEVTAVTAPGFLQATPESNRIATIPVVVSRTGSAPQPSHLLLYRRRGAWFLRTGAVEEPVPGDFESASLSPGGRWLALAVGGEGGTLRILERVTRNEVGRFPVPGRVDRLAWSASGGKLAVVSGERLFLVDPVHPSSPREVWLPGDSRPYSLSWAGLGTRMDFHTLTSVWHAFEGREAEAAAQDLNSYLGPGLPLTSADWILPNPRDEESFLFTRPVPRDGKPDTRHALFLRYRREVREIGEPDASYIAAAWAPDGPWIYAQKFDTRAEGGIRLMRHSVIGGGWVAVAEGAEQLSIAAPVVLPENVRDLQNGDVK